MRQANAASASALPGAAMLLAGIGAGSDEDTLYVREFVHSPDLLLKLERALQLRQHFGAAKPDLLYRLRAGDEPGRVRRATTAPRARCCTTISRRC